jgi:hypothetical protein
VVRVAVEQHQARAVQQPRHEVVPHHPAGRREPEDAVALARVDVQVQLLQLLQQDSAVALDDVLGVIGLGAGTLLGIGDDVETVGVNVNRFTFSSAILTLISRKSVCQSRRSWPWRVRKLT